MVSYYTFRRIKVWLIIPKLFVIQSTICLCTVYCLINYKISSVNLHKTHISKFSPETTLKLVGTTGSTDDPHNQVWPLYFASKINALDIT